MAIEAISGVRNNGLSSVNFEARKGKKSAPVSNPTSTVKAVPLAVILAMSPMTTTNAENIMRGETNSNVIELVENQPSNKVVESKTFEKDFFNYYVNVEKDSKNADAYKIRVLAETAEYVVYQHFYDGYVTGFNKVNYGVYDDSGKKVSQFDYKHIALSDVNNEYPPESVTDKDVCKYVEQLITKYNIDITPQKRNFSLKMTDYGDLIHSKPTTDWLKETTVAYTGKYGKIYNSGDIETEDGPYRVYMHSTDNNDQNFEAVSIVNKDGTIRHRVKGIVACNVEVYPYMGDEFADIALHQINVVDPEGRVRTICNKELWNTLLQLSKVTDFNKAYSLTDVKRMHSDVDSLTGKLSASKKAL